MVSTPQTFIATTIGRVAIPKLADTLVKTGADKFVKQYGQKAFEAVLGTAIGARAYSQTEEYITEYLNHIDSGGDESSFVPKGSMPTATRAEQMDAMMAVPNTTPFAGDLKVPGVIAPDATEMEREAEKIREMTKPIGLPADPPIKPDIKTGETTPPKIDTVEEFPAEDKPLPKPPGFGEGDKIDIPIIFNMKDGKPEFKYPTEEEIKEYINEENEFWKKNIENANKQNPQYSPKNMPQVVEADKHFGAAAYTFQNYDDSKLIYMSPDEYLSLTKEYRSEEGKENLGSKTNIKNLETLLKEGKELANIPILYVNKPFEDSDSFEVVGQEGNHRAKAFKNLGYDKIPVVIEGSTREIREKIRDIFPTNIFSFSNYNKDKKEYEQYDSVLTKPTDFYDVLTKKPLFDRTEKTKESFDIPEILKLKEIDDDDNPDLDTPDAYNEEGKIVDLDKLVKKEIDGVPFYDVPFIKRIETERQDAFPFSIKDFKGGALDNKIIKEAFEYVGGDEPEYPQPFDRSDFLVTPPRGQQEIALRLIKQKLIEDNADSKIIEHITNLQNELNNRIKETGYFGQGAEKEENLNLGIGLFNELKRKKNAEGGIVDLLKL